MSANAKPVPGPEPAAEHAPADAAMLWNVLTNQPETGVAVLRVDGSVLYANNAAAVMIRGTGASGADTVGKNIRDLFPKAWVEERVGFLQQVVETGEPIVVRGIWNGKQGLSWWTRVEDEEGEGDRVLIVTRRVAGDEEIASLGLSQVHLVEAQVVKLGPLEVLSPRELEVLALLSQGMTIEQIAAQLYRSEKTVARHRESIGRKLDVSDRLKLAKLAWKAGLTVSDAGKVRV